MALIGFGIPPPAFQPVVMAVVLYNGSEEEARKVYEPLFKLGPLAGGNFYMNSSSAEQII
jgi:hypothetical protein